jgi:hypothetical protein
VQVITLEEARRLCNQYEGTLRASFATAGGLPGGWEAELARVPADTAPKALSRFALLKHYYLTRVKELEQPEVVPEEAEKAARQLLRREPVRVDLGGHLVSVTGRSYAALYEVAAHDAEIRTLEADLEVCARLAAATEAELAAAPGWRRGAALRRRIRRLRRIHVRIYRELRTQRRWLYAHALTPTGAPARSVDEAPAWTDEIDQAADALLLAATIAAGHARYAQLGEPPPSKESGKKPKGEDFGWGSLFATVERQQRLPNGTLYDTDLFQLRAWLRAGAPPPLDLED